VDKIKLDITSSASIFKHLHPIKEFLKNIFSQNIFFENLEKFFFPSTLLKFVVSMQRLNISLYMADLSLLDVFLYKYIWLFGKIIIFTELLLTVLLFFWSKELQFST